MFKRLKKRTFSLVVMITALLSCLAIGLTGAKFYSEFTGRARGNVAKFDVQVSSCPTEVALTADKTFASLEFTVKSNSDVPVVYDVVVTLPSQTVLPDGVTFALSINGNNLNYSVNENVYTFSDANLLKFNQNDNNLHTLRLTVGASDFSQDLTVADIRIDVVASQTYPT